MAMNIGERTACTSCGSVLLVCQNPECRKPFPRKKDEPEAHWGTRRFCSIPCAQATRQKIRFDGYAPATKPCEQCGGECVQRKGESPMTFEKRRFCSTDCTTAFRRAGAKQREAEAAERRAVRLERKAKPKPKPEPKPAVRYIPPAPPRPEVPTWRPGLWREMEKT